MSFVLLVLSASVCAAAETRIALVIGNGTYREAPLNNPPEDARLIADTLKRLGFTMIGTKPLIDADQKTMKQAIRTFGEQLERAGSSGVGLFFYAGHAVQANGKNYLIPVGADIRGEVDLEDDAVSADSVLVRMTYAGARVNLVVLDACRNNPYRGRSRSLTRGLAEMSAPYGSLVAYSTAPGNVAEDGTGKNSPYSAALAEAMGIANMPVELAFKRVRSVVMQATGNRQVPWESSSLVGEFYFAQTALVPPPAQASATKTPREQYARAFSLLEKRNYEEAGAGFSDFLKSNPNDPLAYNARYWLAQTYYARGEFARSAEIFLDAYEKDKTGPKAPDILLKLGLSLAALGKKNEACASFRELNRAFPNAPDGVKERSNEEAKRINCS